MKFVKHSDIFGVESKEIPCILGEGAPTTATEGAVGCLYMNTLTADVYLCTAKSEGVYTWNVLNRTSGLTAKIGEVTLFAEKWVGADNLYSQIVEIEGVTENSQVDLTPDVQQLAIFYNKDISFVTENEDGVVTVYAIGQKPTNDYTIQVTITEVNV